MTQTHVLTAIQKSFQSRLGAAILAMTFFVFPFVGEAGAKSQTTFFDVPDAVIIGPYALNSKGTIAGTFLSKTSGLYAGFLRYSDGTISILATKDVYLRLLAINAKGDAVGSRGNSGLLVHPNGKKELFSLGDDTIGTGINDEGTITGTYNSNGADHGFVRTKDGASVLFDATGSGQTRPQAINNSGTVTGYTLVFDSQGFVRTADGTLTVFDVPNSTDTTALAINSDGRIVGSFGYKSAEHGFIREVDGSFETFDVPGSRGTYPRGINDKGIITGYYTRDYVNRGFVRTAKGTIITFDPNGSVETDPFAINERGDVSGAFIDPSGAHLGFVRNKGK